MGITVGGAQDGPQGDVRGNGASQFPSQVVVGASWDRAMAQRYGDAIGEEFRARNKTGVLSPDGDIVRTWRWGRQSENYGEDPYHQSQLIAPEVAGIQSNHVRATVKHLTRVQPGDRARRPGADRRRPERAGQLRQQRADPAEGAERDLHGAARRRRRGGRVGLHVLVPG